MTASPAPPPSDASAAASATPATGGPGANAAADDVAGAVARWEASGRRIRVDAHDIDVWVRDVPAADGGTAGDPALLVLHGFPTCSFDWAGALDILSATRRVVLFDCCGFGLSDKPDRRYGIHLHADCATAVVQATGLADEPFVIVAHDMGTSVAGELLARSLDGTLDWPIAGHAVSNGSIYLELAQLTPGQQLLLALPDAALPDPGGAGDAGAGFKAALRATYAPDSAVSDAELDAEWELMSRRDGHLLMPRLIRYLEDRRAEEDRYTGALATHPSPLGIVWGDRDPVAVHAMAERLHEQRPDAQRIRLDGIGHYPMVEAPHAFADALLRVVPGAGAAG